jgi:hypothetical protein
MSIAWWSAGAQEHGVALADVALNDTPGRRHAAVAAEESRAEHPAEEDGDGEEADRPPEWGSEALAGSARRA